MKILVWQWGRRGGGPRYAVELAEALRSLPDTEVVLSLSTQSELLQQHPPPRCEWPIPTYDGLVSGAWRFLTLPLRIGGLARRIRAFAPDVAICAMPGLLDLAMAAALRRAGVPFFAVIHDADPHPGDGLPLQMQLQHRLANRAAGLVALSAHVADRLRETYHVGSRPVIVTGHPPRRFSADPPPPPRAHGGKLRLLSFGRLLPYKGLDLLADALRQLGPTPELEMRIAGNGPESATLDALRALPFVTVDNRWIPEAEIGGLIAWADALVLSHREASQSGGAAAAITAGRWVVATRVGGITEQLTHESLARLCDPTPDSLARALRDLITNPPTTTQPSNAPTWTQIADGLVREIGKARPGIRPAPR